MSQVDARQYENVLVLSNAVELGARIIQKVAGNEIADGFGGEAMTHAELTNALAAKVNSYLMNPTRGAQ